MEKATSPNQIGTLSTSRTGPILSIVAALVGPLCVVFLTGFLTIQLQMSEIGAPLLDFNSRPVPVTGAWLPYLLRAGLVLLALAAVLGYRLAARTSAARVVTLVVLVAAAFVGAYTLRPVPEDGESHPIALFSLMNGAASQFTLALVGAVIVDMISARQRRRRANPQ
jgi:hypothetical protein